jgi:AraC family transcriptional regulator
MIDDTDFELYLQNTIADCFCEIWIPVEKKK